MRVIGLTGGIAMGKSTVAQVFRCAGVPVFDADATVHRLQGPGGAAVPAIEQAFPGTVRNGMLDRPALRRAVLNNPEQLTRLEAIMHPMVRAQSNRFLAQHRSHGARLVVLDIPLLFETRRQDVDLTVVATAPSWVQRQRLRCRGSMTADQILAVITRQMPDRQKRHLADVLIRTGLSRHHARRQIRRLIASCR